MRRRWNGAVAAWGAPEGARRGAAAAVLQRYAEAHRRYHTVEHLSEVLAVLDAVPHDVAVELAAWFHDAVYDPRAAPGASERASADLAASVLAPLGAPDVAVAEVRRLIELTAGHVAAPGDVPGSVLLDADLWILGAPARRYQRYASDVRAEYGHLSEGEWRAGRSQVLRGFAARPRIYLTDRAHRALDTSARANLAWELATLGGGEAEA